MSHTSKEVRRYEMREIEEHNTLYSCWIVLKHKVYDITPFYERHPGGEDVILDAAGMDATEVFEDVGHSADAHQLLDKYCIGEVMGGKREASGRTDLPAAPAQTSRKRADRILDVLDKLLTLLIVIGVAVGFSMLI